MVLGHGPRKLVELFEDNWAASRTGRGDVPEIIKQQTQGEDFRAESGVLALKNRSQAGVDRGKHDIIHCYQPEANPPASTDNGYKEERLIETVQVDIDLVDRTENGERLAANARMIGEAADIANLNEPPYPGIAGEVKQILEGVRRGFSIWDTVSHDYVNHYLGNSNATVSITVELEQIARNTVQ